MVALQLCKDTQAKVNPQVQQPQYDSISTCGIVHLGIGAFHRAHQAIYTDSVIQESGDMWGICGVSLRRATVRDRLAPQDYLYTVIEKAAHHETARIVGVLQNIIVAPEQPTAVITQMANPGCKIVSLTITEKGYYHDPASGKLQLHNSNLQHDLKHLDVPQTAIGFIVAALQQRYQQQQQPFTVLSCDNLPHNGKLLRNLVLEFANAYDTQLAKWIKDNVAFPSTMVDRIVPATTANDINEAEKILNVTDKAVIICEPFKQWVIEDHFCNSRPQWELAGAQFVQDVAPFENMKLRMLNGCHSTLAYLGYLAGYEFIYQVMENTAFVTLIDKMMCNEIIPTLTVPEATDLLVYKDQLIERFKNPNVKHKTYQVAMDGSQKLPQRLLNTIRDRIATSADYSLLALAVASWIRYACGINEQGEKIFIQDPLAKHFAQIAAQDNGDVEQLVQQFTAITEIFGTDLAHDSHFQNKLTYYLAELFTEGAETTVTTIVAK